MATKIPAQYSVIKSIDQIPGYEALFGAIPGEIKAAIEAKLVKKPDAEIKRFEAFEVEFEGCRMECKVVETDGKPWIALDYRFPGQRKFYSMPNPLVHARKMAVLFAQVAEALEATGNKVK